MGKIEFERTENAIARDIIRCFNNRDEWYRKELINECVKKFNLPKEELNDQSSNSMLTKCKSLIGGVISKMIESNTISVSETKLLTLIKEDEIAIQELEVNEYLDSLFKENYRYTKKELFALCEEKFETNKTIDPSDDFIIHQIVGNYLSRQIKAKVLTKVNSLYEMSKVTKYPNTEIGHCLMDASYDNNTYKYFIKILNLKGGEFFEQYSVRLLEKYFIKCQKTINSTKVTGGADDKGIDGVILVTDELGFSEKIFIQVKLRSTMDVKLKEVREFLGASVAQKGTRSIFVTNSGYHVEALKLINSVNNLVGIDGKKLFELAKRCLYGVRLINDSYCLDPDVFL